VSKGNRLPNSINPDISENAASLSRLFVFPCPVSGGKTLEQEAAIRRLIPQFHSLVSMLSTALQNLVAAFPMLRRAVAESGVVTALVMRARVILGIHYETVAAAWQSAHSQQLLWVELAAECRELGGSSLSSSVTRAPWQAYTG
jgi:hypothetical protein